MIKLFKFLSVHDDIYVLIYLWLHGVYKGAPLIKHAVVFHYQRHHIILEIAYNIEHKIKERMN